VVRSREGFWGLEDPPLVVRNHNNIAIFYTNFLAYILLHFQIIMFRCIDITNDVNTANLKERSICGVIVMLQFEHHYAVMTSLLKRQRKTSH